MEPQLTLHPHQRDAVVFLAERGRAIYADEAGSGKTVSTLCWAADEPGPVVVLAPNDVVSQWVTQASRWWTSGGLVDGRGTPKRRRAARDLPPGWGLALNYEAARSDTDALLPVVDGGTLVADEAHLLKNHSSLVFRRVARLARRADRLALLTGTPLLNHPEEVWSLLHLLDPREYRSYWAWVQEHFEITITDFHGRLDRPARIIGGFRSPDTARQLRDTLHSLMLYRTGLVAAHLPPPTVRRHRVDLTHEERAAYDALTRRHWAVLDGEFIQTVNAVGRMVRHRQLASEWSALNENLSAGTKVQTVVRLVQDLAEPAVIFTAFKATARRLADEVAAVGVTPVVFTGDVAPADRRHARDRFVAGQADVIIGTFGTMCEGVDGLQVARHVVLLDRDWTPARNQQAVARVHREGQSRPVVVHEIVAADTVDDVLTDVLDEKITLLDQILSGP